MANVKSNTFYFIFNLACCTCWHIIVRGAATVGREQCESIELAARRGGRAARGGVAVTAVGGAMVWHY